MEQCEKCVVHRNIIKEYSDKLLEQQKQIEILSARLLKYETDVSAEQICEVKVEENSENDIVSDHDAVNDYTHSYNDFKILEPPDHCSESSIGLDPDHGSETSKDQYLERGSDDSSDHDVRSMLSRKIKRKLRKCKDCDEAFSSSRALVKHQHQIHGAPIKFKCDRCPKTFYDGNSFKKHCGTSHRKASEIEKEKQRFYCDTCAKSFTSNSVLVVHKRIHTALKPTKSSLPNLQILCIFHPIFRCHACRERREKPYKCSSCDNRYAQSSSLKIHERTHSFERPYMCHLCSKTFLHRSSFNLHIKTHGDIRPHKCNICQKAFLQKAKLVVHIQSHTGERPVKCPVCDKGYTKRYHVRKHLKNFHKVIDIDAILGSKKRGFEREPVPYNKLEPIQVKKE